MANSIVSDGEIRSIMPMIMNSMRAYADMPALYYGQKCYTYGELDKQSGAIAFFLRQHGVSKGDIVSVLVPRCEYMTIAALGVLRAGGAYQPIDVSYPMERIKFMIMDADTPVIITSKEFAHLIEPFNRSEKSRIILYIEDIPDLPDINGDVWENVSSDDRFVILYTSGTTGVPKGIILTHGNIYSACKWHIDYYEADSGCRMGQHPSFVFDLAIVELLLPLTVGASIYIIPEEIRTDINELNLFLEKNRITHLTMTTQLGRQFAMTVNNNSLKHLTVGGEALISVAPPQNYKLHNDYGPAECTLYTTIFNVDKEYTGKVPIGKAVDEVRLYVVDEDGREVSDDVMGELCIAGPHVALGYLNRPELTDKAFTNNPFSDDPGYERMYHSGDLVIRHKDGIFEFMGRADRQVKIRGIRIEPAEIEELLRKHDEIDDVVISTPETGGQRVLAAYYLADRELDAKSLEEYVLSNKPSYMCPSFFIRIHKIPLNTNGKVDYERLPLPDFELNKASYDEPADETERILVSIYEELLKITQIGRNDDFMRIGGNSILVSQLIFQIEQKLSSRLSIRDIMENPVVSDLAKLIDKREKKDKDTLFDHSDDKVLPVREFYQTSKAQDRIYTAQKMLKDNDPTYLLCMKIRTEGKLDIDRTEDVLVKLFTYHESLRTLFYMQDLKILQKIHPADPKWLRAAVKKAHVKEAPSVYRLEEAPLFWWDLRDGEITFYWHHIINDGTGTALFAREFADLYNGVELKNAVMHQKEYADWENKWMASDAYKQCRNEWVRRILECVKTEELRLAYDGIFNEEDKRRAGHIRLELGRERSGEIEESCRKFGVTPYMFFISVFSVLLHKYSGMDRFCIGTVADGRVHRNMAELQGMFANTLPVPVNINDSFTFSEFLAYIRDNVLFMLDNRQVSLEDIAAECAKTGGRERTAHGHLLFDVLFVMRDFDSVIPKIGGCTSKLYWPYDEMPMYDLTLEAGKEDGSYYFVFEYDKNLFAEESMHWFSSHYDTLLKSCLDPGIGKINTISMISEKERDFLLEQDAFSDTVFEYDTVIDRLRRQKDIRPDKTAVVFGETQLTYKELWDVSGKIAGKLLEKYSSNGNDGTHTEHFVGLIASRGLGMIASIMGILRSGAGYVPISPEYPKERILYMLKEADADCVIVSDADVSLLKMGVGQPFIEISLQELLNGADEELSDECRLPLVKPEQNAYMIFTSGSTGEPKGVVAEHRQLSALLDAYSGIYELNDKDSVLQFANYVFDQSVWDIFHILSVGGTLCLIPDQIVRDPDGLADYCDEKGVTAASLTPGFLRLLDPLRFKKLRLLDVGGEAPDNALLKAWSLKRTVFNTYGPTETTVNATSFMYADKGRILYTADRCKENVPIGRAVPGTSVYILNGNELCGIGVPGELCITGRQVTRGYHNRPELTDEKYVLNPFGEGRMYRSGDLARVLPDGNIEFIHRIDDQVKLRGYRIEPGETEAVMRSLDSVKDASVVIYENESKERTLCGYYIPANGDHTDKGVSDIREQLEKLLPVYMIPPMLIPVKEFKLTINGKIDRKALPKPLMHAPEKAVSLRRTLPETKQEADCIRMFKEVLNIEDMGVTDDFLALGGDSIKAIRIVSLLRKMGYDIDTATILRCKTVRSISSKLKEDAKTEYREYKEVIPTPVMRMFRQADMFNPDHYVQSAVFAIKGDTDINALEWALNGLTVYHGMLRMILDKDGSIRIRDNEELSAIKLSVFDAEDEKSRTKIMDSVNASMDPKNGIVMQAALLRTRSKDRLFLSFHHYVIDEVSWEILTDDLNMLYDAAAGKDIFESGYGRVFEILQKRTVSFGEWSQSLVKYRESPDFISERDYWDALHQKIVSYRETGESILGYFTMRDTPKCKGSGIIRAEIGKDVSDKVRRISLDRFRTRPDVLLIAVLVSTLHKLSGDRCIMLQMESHGRGNTGEGLTCERTVGWFTSVYPVLIPVLDDMDDQIVQVKEELAAVPNYGLGYGLLYEDLVELGGFVFNYLGSLRSGNDNTIQYTGEYAGVESDSKNVDPGTISVNIREYDDGLEIECVYDCIYAEEKIRGFIAEYIEMLKSSSDKLPETGIVISPSDLCISRIMTIRDFSRLSALIKPEDIEAIGVPTPLQQGMLYRLAAQPDTGAYLLQDRLMFRHEWNKDAFIKALKLTLGRFDALRIRYAISGFDEPWQIILKEDVCEPEYLEISGHSIEDIAADDLRRGFDPEKDSLFRVTFNADSAGSEIKELLISSHHCIIDGWSFRILIDHAADNYLRLLSGESYDALHESVMNKAAGSLSFSDYLRLVNKRDREISLHKWDDYLKGISEGAGIGQPIENESGGIAAYLHLPISDEKERQIRKYAGDNKITLSSFFGTVFGILLGFENDISDVVFGETVSGRNINADGIENAVGMFINTIPVRIKWDDDTVVSELMTLRQDDYIKMQECEDAPLHKIMSRKKAGTSLIRTLYVYENYPADEEDDRCRIVMQHEEVDYPLSIAIEEKNGFVVELQYDSSRYDVSYIEKLLNRYDDLISRIISNEDMKISELERIPKEEMEYMLSDISGFDKAFPEVTFIDMLYEHVKDAPDKCAVIMDENSLTYEQLWMASLELASRLREGEERFVAVYADRGLGMIVSLIAVFMAGAAYVPLDPDYPDDRINFILADCTPTAILRCIDGGTKERTELFENAGLSVTDVCVNELLESKAPASIMARPVKEMRDSLAYMIYTSGTTGLPKGVEIEHGALSEMILSNLEFMGDKADDVHKTVLQTANYVFDASVFELFVPLASGGTVCMISRDKLNNAEAMARYCRDNKVTYFASTNAFLQALDPDKFDKFDVINAGGDAANADIFAKWSKHAGQMLNDYGPTEACVNALAYRYTPSHTGAIPIGRPYANKKVYILQHDKLCGIGQKGEICIGGKGLARGYHNREELNSQVFVRNPYTGERIYRTGDIGYFGQDGNVYFWGRYDDQVKIRGYRIETGEIESRIREYGSVREAAVISRNDGSREAYLAAYITSDEAVDVDMLKAYLMKKLPSYMVPVVITRLDRLPRNASDKLDTDALPVPEFSSDKAAPEGYLEEMTAALFEKLLGVKKVGRDDSFFDLGGSSLDMMRLISELNGYHISIADVSAAPTPRLFAEFLLRRYRGSDKKEDGAALLKEGSEDAPAIFCIPPSGGMSLCYLPLIKELDHDGAVYGLTDIKYASFADMTLEELVLFKPRKQGMWDDTIDHYYRCIRRLFKDGDILIGYSQGGPVAYLVAQRLENDGCRIGRIIMLEAPEPGEADLTEDDKYERMAVAAAIFTGRTKADECVDTLRKEQVSEIDYFRDCLRDVYGAGTDDTLLHSMLETYQVYSSNVLNPLIVNGRIAAKIDSIILGGSGDLNKNECVIRHNDPWSAHSNAKGEAYIISGEAGEHLAFLSKYRKQISRIVKNSFMK